MKNLIILLVCGLIQFNALAQSGEQVKDWSVGADKGYALLSGEVRPGSGFGFGISGEKSITQYLSARLRFGMGELRGMDRVTSTNWINHPVWNGRANPAIDYNQANSNFIFANYKTGYLEASLQAVFTFTQLPGFKNSSPFDGFLFAGIGAMRYQAKVDAMDEIGLIYDFATVTAMPSTSDLETFSNLNTILDGNYETEVTRDAQFTQLYQIGAGIQWRIKERFTLSLSHRVSFAGKDDLDSYQWDQNNVANGVKDIHHYTSVGLSYAFKMKAKQNRIPDTPMLPPSPPDPLPAPEPAVEIVELTKDEEEVIRRAFESTEFETDKAIIRPESFNSLNELATLLSEHPNWKLRVTGHTDNTGTAEWNMDLSKRRTESVRDYLTKRNIDASRLILTWHGEEQPIADNSTKEGRQRNRRVEYEIVE